MTPSSPVSTILLRPGSSCSDGQLHPAGSLGFIALAGFFLNELVGVCFSISVASCGRDGSGFNCALFAISLAAVSDVF